jgi:hypothetical protein
MTLRKGDIKMKKLSGMMRLWIFISVLWFVAVFAYGFIDWHTISGWGVNHDVVFLYAFLWGTIPLLVCWGTWWVIQGFKKK